MVPTADSAGRYRFFLAPASPENEGRSAVSEF